MAADQLEFVRFRTLSGVPGHMTRALLMAIPVVGALFILDVPIYLKLSIWQEQYLCLFLGMVLAGTFLLVLPYKGAARDRIPWYDMVLAALGFGVGLYVAFLYPAMLERIGIVDTPRVVVSTLVMVLVLEAVRRLTGWFLVILGLAFILYGRFTWLAPGIFAGKGVPWPQLSSYLLVDPNSLLGLALGVAAVIILSFILFGNILFAIGASAFLTDLSMAALGRFRGGPAKMAIVASSLFGTISGTAVSNVATVGVITIPLMKQTGFKPHMAAAIEAVASTGGQLMPPVMGAAAFLIAQFLSIPYATVAMAAIFPAILFYVAVFVQVDLEAAKTGLLGIPRDKLPRLRGILKDSWLFVIPLGVLVVALFGLHYPPSKAGLAAVLAGLVMGLVAPQTRFRGGWVLHALEGTGRTMLELGAIVALAGFIIGVMSRTGLGFNFSMFLTDFAGGNILLLLVTLAAANIILGMGMPTVVVYILLAVLGGPALIQLGIDPLAAHLFIFYFGMLSMITPPICFAVYAAAAIAGSSYMRTGYAAMRLGIVAYFLPFLFVFSPALLLKGTPIEILQAVVFSAFATYLIGIVAVGYLFRPLHPAKRVVVGVAAMALFVPIYGESGFGAFGLLINIIGIIMACILIFWEWKRVSPSRRISK